MKEYGLPEPVFENRRDEFVVTFYNEKKAAPPESGRPQDPRISQGPHGSQEPESPREKMTPENAEQELLTYCQTPKSRQEIADHMHVKTAFYAMSKYVQPLLESGKLGMTIADRLRSKNQRYYTVDDYGAGGTGGEGGEDCSGGEERQD